MEFDCRTSSGAPAMMPSPRIPPVPLIFMRATHYIGRYDGEGIEFACPRLIVELPNRSAATPASLLSALNSPKLSGFSDFRFTSEMWEIPPTTPAGDFNVMTHAWMFGHLDLAHKLQNNADVIIGAFEPHGIVAAHAAAAAAQSNSANSARPAAASARTGRRVADGSSSNQALPVNSIQRMRVSMHMMRGSPAFSPNNCKLRLQGSNRTCSFWLLKGDPATRRAMISFVCLLPPLSNAAFIDAMAQQRKCASEAPDAPPSATLHALLARLHSHPSLVEAAAALGASLMVSDDRTLLRAADTEAADTEATTALVQLSNMQLGGAAAGGGEGAHSPAPTPQAIHSAIKGKCIALASFSCRGCCSVGSEFDGI
jgi:hypothetical protein